MLPHAPGNRYRCGREHPRAPVGRPVVRDVPQKVYPALSARAAPGGAGDAPEASVSALMSMRQPVNLAAKRAFCPSRPIAKESWKSGTITRAVLLVASTTS